MCRYFMSGEHKKGIWKEIVRRFRFKYRVSVLNENTLEEAWHVKLSRMSLFVYSCLLLLLTFGIMACVIIFTPLRGYLPGSDDASLALEARRQADKLDSLDCMVGRNEAYMSVLRAVVSGELPADSTDELTEVEAARLNSTVLSPMRNEMAFRSQYEEQERFSIDEGDVDIDVEKMVFFRPVDGVVEYDTSDGGHSAVITTVEGTAVMSVLDGMVIDVHHDLGATWTVVISHRDNYVSVCGGLNKPFVSVGSSVSAGEAVGTACHEGKVVFRLWHNMEPADLTPVL